jgi:hypothetical protein
VYSVLRAPSLTHVGGDRFDGYREARTLFPLPSFLSMVIMYKYFVANQAGCGQLITCSCSAGINNVICIVMQLVSTAIVDVFVSLVTTGMCQFSSASPNPP